MRVYTVVIVDKAIDHFKPRESAQATFMHSITMKSLLGMNVFSDSEVDAIIELEISQALQIHTMLIVRSPETP